MKKAAILLIGIFSSLLLIGCSAQEAVYTNLSGAEDDAQVVIKGRTGDSTYQVPILDPVSHTIKAIDFEHSQIHEGHSFFVHNVVDLGNGANSTLLIVTPNTTTWAHIVREIDIELESSFNLYEDSIVSANGTPLTAVNRDRNSANTAEVLFFSSPTVTDFGTLISQSQLGSGKKAGGGGRDTSEIILKQNTKYLFVITNLTTNNNVISSKISWYEHTNRSP